MMVQARVRDEMKTCDTALTSGKLNFDSTSIVDNMMQQLNAIPQNTSPIGRIGKRCIMKALQIRGHIFVGTATVYERISLMLVYVRNVNAITGTTVLPAITEILATQSSISLTNRDYASKHKILRRWDYVLTGNRTTPTTGREGMPFEEYIVFKKPLLVQYTGISTTGVYNEVEKGALLLISLGLSANGSTTTPVFVGNSRLYFSESDGYAY